MANVSVCEIFFYRNSEIVVTEMHNELFDRLLSIITSVIVVNIKVSMVMDYMFVLDPHLCVAFGCVPLRMSDIAKLWNTY